MVVFWNSVENNRKIWKKILNISKVTYKKIPLGKNIWKRKKKNSSTLYVFVMLPFIKCFLYALHSLDTLQLFILIAIHFINENTSLEVKIKLPICHMAWKSLSWVLNPYLWHFRVTGLPLLAFFSLYSGLRIVSSSATKLFNVCP